MILLICGHPTELLLNIRMIGSICNFMIKVHRFLFVLNSKLQAFIILIGTLFNYLRIRRLVSYQ